MPVAERRSLGPAPLSLPPVPQQRRGRGGVAERISVAAYSGSNEGCHAGTDLLHHVVPEAPGDAASPRLSQRRSLGNFFRLFHRSSLKQGSVGVPLHTPSHTRQGNGYSSVPTLVPRPRQQSRAVSSGHPWLLQATSALHGSPNYPLSASHHRGSSDEGTRRPEHRAGPNMPLQLTVTRPPAGASRRAGSCQPLNAGR